MTEKQFSRLPFLEQIAIMRVHAIKIALRTDGVNRYFLYQMGSFYLEAKFHIEANGIFAVRAFLSDEDLDPFLDNIDLSSLIEP